MKTAYLYVRVSTDEQKRKDYSLPEQEDRLLKYCEFQDIIVKGVYREDYSAAKPITMKKFSAMVMIAAMSFGVVTSTHAFPRQQQKHLKKDGTPDMRYKENKKKKTN